MWIEMNDKQENHYVISQENWSLHRKGHQDQQRHIDKVKDAIKNNLPDLISDESIIMSNGRDVIKIPIRSLDEYKIRYNYDKSKHVGQGNGDSQVGDVVARGSDEGENGAGKGKKAGDQADPLNGEQHSPCPVWKGSCSSFAWHESVD